MTLTTTNGVNFVLTLIKCMSESILCVKMGNYKKNKKILIIKNKIRKRRGEERRGEERRGDI